MNKQDRQNKTIKREREILIPCQPPSSPSANVTMGGSSTPCRIRGRTGSGAPRAGLRRERGHARSQREVDFRISHRPSSTQDMFSEQSWVWGQQTVWVTGTKTAAGGGQGPQQSHTHTHSQRPQAAPNLRLRVSWCVSGSEVTTLWVFLGAHYLSVQISHVI